MVSVYEELLWTPSQNLSLHEQGPKFPASTFQSLRGQIHSTQIGATWQVLCGPSQPAQCTSTMGQGPALPPSPPSRDTASGLPSTLASFSPRCVCVCGSGWVWGVWMCVAPSSALPKSTELSGAPAPPQLPSAENSFNLEYSPLYVLDLMPLKIFFS